MSDTALSMIFFFAHREVEEIFLPSGETFLSVRNPAIEMNILLGEMELLIWIRQFAANDEIA